LIITRATEYAIRAVLFLAQQPPGEVVLKRDICATQDITPAFLTKILQPLIKARIVGSQRGVTGGFFLQQEPEDISLLAILEAEEGPLYLNRCLIQDDFCERIGFCPAHMIWEEVRDCMRASLKRATIASLLEKQKLCQQKSVSHQPA
jgi:Rrf2 family protein